MKILPLAAQLFHAGGQTAGRDKDNSHFHSQFREPRLKLPKLNPLTSDRNDISVCVIRCSVWV